MKYKILEKYMTFDEVKSYIESQNKWKLPTKEEIREIADNNESGLLSSLFFYDSSEKVNKRVNTYNLQRDKDISTSEVLRFKIVLVLNNKYIEQFELLKDIVNNGDGDIPTDIEDAIRYVLNIKE